MPAALHRALGGDLPDAGEDPVGVLERLVAAADPGIVASPGAALLRVRRRRHVAGRHGGRLADLGLGPERGPRAAVARRGRGRGGRARAGSLDLLELPEGASVGFVTGGAGWRTRPPGRGAPRGAARRAAGTSRRDGLVGAPAVDVFTGEEAHSTIFSSLRLLGLGAAASRAGRRPTTRAGWTPTRWPRRSTRDRARRSCARRRARSTPARSTRSGRSRTPAPRAAPGCTSTARSGCGRRRRRACATSCAGVERARLVGHRRAQVAQRALRLRHSPSCATRPPTARRWASPRPTSSQPDGERDAPAYVPETSRRARGFPSTQRCARSGRSGVAELVERCCARARRMAERLDASAGLRVLNDVVLNQVLVRFGDDAAARARRCSPRSRTTGPAGWAARPGRGAGDPRLGLELVDRPRRTCSARRRR